MGIDIPTLHFISTRKGFPNEGRYLTLGVQHFHIPYPINEYGDFRDLLKGLEYKLDSIDYSDYEGATIIHDMNKLKLDSNELFDWIIDFGTTEHIFNVPHCYQNILNMLKIEGRFISVVPNNNQSGHGFYQFSPEFFFRVFSGYEIECYLYRNPRHRLFDETIDIIKVEENETKWRATDKFDNCEEVYVCVDIKKLFNKNILEENIIQRSYIDYEWKN